MIKDHCWQGHDVSFTQILGHRLFPGEAFKFLRINEIHSDITQSALIIKNLDIAKIRIPI